MDAKKILGWNIRKIRVAQGITQQQLALDVKIDPAYTGRIERGLENLSINIIEAIATRLNVPLIELFREPSPGEKMPVPLRAGRKKV